MRSWDDFLNEETGKAYDGKVMLAVQAELELARAQKRRAFFGWLAPVGLGIAGVIGWQAFKKGEGVNESGPGSADLLLLTDAHSELGELGEEEFAVLDDLDLLDDLEVLEKWTPEKS